MPPFKVTRPGTKPIPAVARFWRHVAKVESGCWEWTGHRNAMTGYGALNVNRVSTLAHRFSYEMNKGPIPAGLVIDHLCRNRACVNPDHLEVVSQRENCLRGEGISAIRARQTHCANGHPFAPPHLMTYIRNTGNLVRRCRTCLNAWRRANYAAEKGVAA